jgi:hypothetical protein
MDIGVHLGGAEHSENMALLGAGWGPVGGLDIGLLGGNSGPRGPGDVAGCWRVVAVGWV